MNYDCYRRKTFIVILREDRYVRQVGISNMGDLFLGPASLSYELSYFEFLYPSIKSEEH